MKDDLFKYKIKLEIRQYSGSTTGFAFLDDDNEFVHPNPKNDFYLNVFLRRSCQVEDYVDVQKDNEQFEISRQLINPYFIEFGFFDTIQKNKVRRGSDLTQNMINFIRATIPAIGNLTDNEVVYWFDYEGKNIMIKNEKNNITPTLDDLERADLVWDSIVSKANYFPITINK